MNARVYDPDIGKFLSADPTVPGFHNPQAYNRYAYTLNNPLSMVDRDGFEPSDASGNITGDVAGYRGDAGHNGGPNGSNGNADGSAKGPGSQADPPPNPSSPGTKADSRLTPAPGAATRIENPIGQATQTAVSLVDGGYGLKAADAWRKGEASAGLMYTGAAMVMTGMTLSPYTAVSKAIALITRETASLGGTLAAKGVAEAKTVLGHFPEYKRLGDSLNARTFNIPEAAWNKMSEAQRWAANQKFLDRMISREDEIILATPLDKVRPGSYFARELEYMGSKGYVPSADGTRLIKP
jgi:hypothetical protein